MWIKLEQLIVTSELKLLDLTLLIFSQFLPQLLIMLLPMLRNSPLHFFLTSHQLTFRNQLKDFFLEKFPLSSLFNLFLWPLLFISIATRITMWN